MTKKALIVAINEYMPLQANLKSCRIEAEKWKDLLIRRYAFAERDIHELLDCTAGKEAIFDRLRWLLDPAEPGDSLVFIFNGHGARGHRCDASGALLDREDEALLAYPAGLHDWHDVAVFDAELTVTYGNMGVPPGVLPTFIFNCCHAGGLDFADRPHLRQSVGIAGDFARFGHGITLQTGGAAPVVIASTRDVKLAIEVERDGVPRSLFSMVTIDALEKNPGLTYRELMTTIEPLMRKAAAQEPSLQGEEQRTQKPFLQ